MQTQLQAAPAVYRAEQNRMVELRFTSAKEYPDPFNTVQLDAVVTAPDGTRLRVPGFWAGGREWRVRYASPQAGRHAFRTECSDPENAGLHGVAGEVQVAPYTGDNPLYRHGPVRLAGDHRHFEHADGTPFFWLGDTWWMGLCARMHWPEDFQALAADRVAKGFTVVQIVAGLYPDMPPFDPRGANEAGFPWEPEYRAIRPEYFDAADRRLEYLADNGMVPCIVGAWGYFLPWMGVERARQHWRYLIARYGALPVVWCVAGEANLPWYLAKGFPYDDREQVKGWTEVARTVRQADPFRRPLSIHPTGLGRLSARGAIDDPSLLDFDMLQTGHGMREVLAPSIRTLRWSYGERPTMPVLNSEVSYEALLDRIPAEIPRLVFWASMLSGAAGHTYGANGIWQVNRKGQPHGASPHGGNYGTIPWDEAMRLPGSTQLSLGKKLLERYPWQRFEPHPEWVSPGDGQPLTFDGCRWIWFPEGNPAKDAPIEKRCFRKAFLLPEGRAVVPGRLRVSVDDALTAYLNGTKLGSHGDWRTGREFDVTALLRPGRNVLAIEGENVASPVPANPAGLICRLQARLAGGETVEVVSDATWRCSKAGPAGWTEPAFDDSGWAAALEIGAHGDAPWGPLAGADQYEVPYAAGIPGAVRVIYSPRREPVTVRQLEAGKAYTAFTFDPITGARKELGPVPAANGAWTCPPPAGEGPDWVLVLEGGR